MFKEGNLRLVRTPQARWDVRAVQCRAQGSDDGGIVVRVVGNMLSERGIEPVCEAWLAEGMSTRKAGENEVGCMRSNMGRGTYVYGAHILSVQISHVTSSSSSESD